MVFSSITFLFFFLPFTLLIYFTGGAKLRNVILLCASLLFYAWGEGVYLLIMLLSIGLNYCFGRLLGQAEDHPFSKYLLFAAVATNIGILASFKYANFAVDNINPVLLALGIPAIELAPIHLPIGISFFTFQAISYIIDVYQKKVPAQTNGLSLGLYISLFPQLIAGPIVRYHQVARQLKQRYTSLTDFSEGAQRFLYGLAKKVLLANPMGAVADQVFALPSAELSPAVVWLGAICYTFQIYFDFSGYSDMAIGLGRIFGFTFPENFNYPYLSKSIREFWRRWHISLSSWFRDYLYIPLGGNRKGEVRTGLNLLTVFFLCGLWHGASWTFILWGLYHGFFLILERTRVAKAGERMWAPLKHGVTMLIIILGWVLFRAESLDQAVNFYQMMFGMATVQAQAYPLIMLIDTKVTFELLMCLIFSLPIYQGYLALQQKLRMKSQSGQRVALTSCYFLQFTITAGLIYFTTISLAAGAYNPFIYFRF